MKCWFSSFLVIVFLQVQSQSNSVKLANEYYQNGDIEKALTLYKDLQKSKNNIPLIHSNYLSILTQKSNFREAEKYLEKAQKFYPNNFQYKANLTNLYYIQGSLDKKRKQLNEIAKSTENPYQLTLFAQTLANQGLYDDAIDFYLLSRKVSGRNGLNALEIGALYRLNDQKEKMVDEYLIYAESNPRNLAYIKNLFQGLLQSDEDKDLLEKALIGKIQSYPDQKLYSDLIIWLEVQRKNFYAAFLQARALDKRTNSQGNESMAIARLAKQNSYWDDAIDIYDYIQTTYPGSYYGRLAKKELIESRESKIKDQFPIDSTALRQLTIDYQKLYDTEGANPSTLSALRNKALIHAFYLQEEVLAIKTLQVIIDHRRSPSSLAARCKIDLGDIYLLRGEPWESTLLYSQVEKDNKESSIGFSAKLKNAKLNYYAGNFKLAKSHLDILKEATTRDISNDAISLSLLIKNNTAFDSTDHILKEYASLELLAFQNKKYDALSSFLEMEEKYPSHDLIDEILWKQAELFLELGQYQESINKLEKIVSSFEGEILADDALFKQAEIQEKYLKNSSEAEGLYTKLLTTYPGSIYSAEARIKIRKLREENVNG